MKQQCLILLTAALLISLLASQISLTAAPHQTNPQITLPAQPEHSPTFEVSGRVTDQQGLPHLDVRLLAPGGRRLAELRTDAAGRFASAGVHGDAYLLQVLDADWRQLPWEGDQLFPVTDRNPTLQRSHEIRLRQSWTFAAGKEALLTQPVTTTTPLTARSAQITGLVTAADIAQPFGFVEVTAFPVSGGASIRTTSDADDGSYTLNVPGGVGYRIKFAPNEEFFESDYQSEYYDNQRTIAEADILTPLEGGVVANINAALDLGGKITGNVSDVITGAGIATALVTAYDANNAVVQQVVTNTAGEYTLTGLPTGAYRLKFEESAYQREYYQNKTTLATADQVNVTAPSIMSGINAQLAKAPYLTGRVTDKTTTMPLDSVAVNAYQSDGALADSAITNVSGVYTLTELLDGLYWLHFAPLENGPTSDYRAHFYPSEIQFVSPNSQSGIDVVLEKGVRITGKVTAADDNAPLPTVAVELYSDQYELLDTFLTNNAGDYTTTALEAGFYHLHFAPQVASPASAYLPEYYSDAATLATALVIDATASGQTLTHDASLAPGAKISGRVTAADSSAELASVRVVAYDLLAQAVRATVTASDGAYTLSGLPTGSYFLLFDPPTDSTDSAADYIAQVYNNRTSPLLLTEITLATALATADSVTVTASGETANINAALTRGGRITGVLAAIESNQPIKACNIELLTADGQAAALRVCTDDEGRFLFSGLPAGAYFLYFAEEETLDAVGRMPGFHRDQFTLATATPIAVTAGNVTSVTMLHGAGQLHGVVTASDSGNPLAAVSVTLYDDQGNRLLQAETDSSGAYHFMGLPNGGYRLHFAPSADSPYLAANYASPLTITTRDTLTNLNMGLERGGQISGRVTSAHTGAALNNVQVLVYGANGVALITMTGNDGLYTTPGLPSGQYRLRFGSSNWGYTGYTGGGHLPLLHPNPMTVVAPNMVSDIDAALPLGATLRGRVTAQDTGQPLVDVAVDLQDCNQEERTRTNFLGFYEFSGLPSGAYQLDITPDAYTAAAPYIAMLNTPLTLTPPQGFLKNLALARGGQISGQVTGERNGPPLEDTWTHVLDTTGKQLAVAATDLQGIYKTTGLPSGNYHVYFDTAWYESHRAYLAEYYKDVNSVGQAQTIPVNGAVVVRDVNGALARGGQLAGWVSDSDAGMFVASGNATIYDNRGVVQGDSASDGYGNYLSEGLPAGVYRLTLEAYLYLDSYYNQKPDLVAADPVTVNTPTLQIGLNGTVVRGLRFAGRVTAVDGAPLDGARILAYNSAGIRLETDFTSALGNYETDPVPAGEYRLEFNPENVALDCNSNLGYAPEFYNDKPNLATADRLTGGAKSVLRGLEAALPVATVTPALNPTPTPNGDPTATPAASLYLPSVQR